MSGGEFDPGLLKGGAISLLLRDFQPRPEQAELSLAVWQALESERHLLAEAGTGVGKSLGYLLPAGFWAAAHGKRVVVATRTRALQEQLLRQDLPIAEGVLARLGFKLKYALLMGSENYLCVHRLQRARPSLWPQDLDRGGLLSWAFDASTGLRSRLPFPLPDELWRRVNRDSELCPGRKGPYWSRCLYRKDVEAAREAHVVVVNQHLLFAGMPLPAWDALVIDEAHNLAETASRFFGFSLGEAQLLRVAEEAADAARRAGDPEASKAVDAELEALRKGARLFYGALAEAVGLEPEPGETRAKRLREPGLAEDTVSARLAALAGALRAVPAQTREDELELAGHSERVLRFAGPVKSLLALEGGDAYWLEAGPGRRPALSIHRAPVEAGPALRTTLFGLGRPVILTSATLTFRGRFEHFREAVGLDEALELRVPSPFDYAKQRALCLPDGVPDPRAEPEAFEEKAIERCAEVAERVPGGLFFLFTSRKMMRRAHEALAPRLGRETFLQGTGLPYELVERFRAAGNGALFGTDTFWEGVDVPGSALSCVVIVRLPFLAPDSPLEEARQERLAERGEDVFRQLTLPRAVLRFRQGVGRLIRASADRGAVVVLDPRVRTKPYGKAFLDCLAADRKVEGLDGLAAFFAT